MGCWGANLDASDSAQDFQCRVQRELHKGKTLYEISYGYEEEILLLASWQGASGKIDSTLKKCALEQINKEIKYIDAGESGWGDETEEREEVLFKLQGDIADALETKIDVKKILSEYMFSALPLPEAFDKVQAQIDEEAEADLLDFAQLKLQSGLLDQETKSKALAILNRQIENLNMRFHLYDVLKGYKKLKEELEQTLL